MSDPPHLFNVEDGKCYEAYKRGPCTTGQHFKLSQAIGGKPVCSSNPCVNEEYFCNAPRCVKQVGGKVGDMLLKYVQCVIYCRETVNVSGLLVELLMECRLNIL